MTCALHAQGNLFYDRVFRITHYDPTVEMSYTRITTKDGKQLLISASHELHVNKCCSLDESTPAAQVLFVCGELDDVDRRA